MASRALKVNPQNRVKSDPVVQPNPVGTSDQSEIAARAYECWQERGCPVGSDQEDWFRAEEELKERKTLSPKSR